MLKATSDPASSTEASIASTFTLQRVIVSSCHVMQHPKVISFHVWQKNRGCHSTSKETQNFRTMDLCNTKSTSIEPSFPHRHGFQRSSLTSNLSVSDLHVDSPFLHPVYVNILRLQKSESGVKNCPKIMKFSKFQGKSPFHTSVAAQWVDA